MLNRFYGIWQYPIQKEKLIKELITILKEEKISDEKINNIIKKFREKGKDEA